jgi:molecular chaperone HscA
MSKIQINISSGELVQDEKIVGIDLGTTNSLIAIVDPNTQLPFAIPAARGVVSTPSLVHIDQQGDIKVGADALEMIEVDPTSVVYSVKRLIGMNSSDAQQVCAEHRVSYPVRLVHSGQISIPLGGREWSPEEISAEILKDLKKNAERHLNIKIKKAVITVPAYFTDAQRLATREAGRLAGLDVLRIINEPTAASLAYGIGVGQGKSQKVAVYDLGGGTFDISILEITDGVFEVLSTHGNTALGGDDFDNCIIDHWMGENGLSEDFLSAHRSNIRLLAETAKCALSEQDEFRGFIGEQRFDISRFRFEELIHPLIQSTISACEHALRDAGCTVNSIDEVVLVGGSTRVPLVISRVSEYFRREVRHSIDPDQVVALGAAIQADILAGNNKQTLLLDVTPLSLGIETAGGLMDVLIPRNSKIPTRVERQYSTQKDGQTGIRISVFQGERDLVKDNRELSTFILKGIPAMPAGFPKVLVAFQINADGILQVSAKETRTGIEQSIRIDDKMDLDEILIEKMLADSIQHASSDVSERRWVELRLQAEQLIETTRMLLVKNEISLSTAEVQSVKEALVLLDRPLTGKDSEMLKICMNALEKLVRPLSERVMNDAMRKALEDNRS